MRVLTYNTWQLPFPLLGGKNRAQRFELLAPALAATHADVLLLQEVWVPRLQKQLAARLQAVGYNDVFGRQKYYQDGLMIASRSPFASEVEFMGYDHKSDGLERFLKKGALKVTINLPKLGPVLFVCLHLPAATTDESRYQALVDLLKWLEPHRGQPTVIGGDFNFYPSQFGDKYWQALTAAGGFTPTIPTAAKDDSQHFTWCPNNKYAAETEVFGHLDQIWIRDFSVTDISGQVMFRSRDEWAKQSSHPPELSDHLGWAASFS